MKRCLVRLVLARLLSCSVVLVAANTLGSGTDGGNPLEKVTAMLSSLQQKIISEGQTAHHDYVEYAEWCEEKAKQLQYEIKSGRSEVDELKATIEEEQSTIEELTAKVDELSTKAATAGKNLKDATTLREKEHSVFVREEKELSKMISTLKRAISMLSRGSAAAAAMLQLPTLDGFVGAFRAMVDASVISSADASLLTALVQSSSTAGGAGTQRNADGDGEGDSDNDGDDDDDADSGAPEAAAYEKKSGGIISTMEGLLDKAEDQLDKLRAAEQKALGNFEMLELSLKQEGDVAAREMEEAKFNMAGCKERSGIASGDLDVTSKDLAEDVNALSEVHGSCMKTAEDFENAVKSRDEEMSALATAKKALSEISGGGGDFLQDGSERVSFLQTHDVSTGGPKTTVVRLILEMARKQDSRSLAQLATRISAAIRRGKRSGAGDPFGKVRNLISTMITKLEEEAQADATQKSYCDKETKEITKKKLDKTGETEKLGVSIDSLSGRIAVLRNEVSTITTDLSIIAKEQKELDAWMQELKETFAANKAEMESGIKGVKKALKVLRNYYAKGDESGGHEKSEGAGGSIIGLLEVVESDFTKTLAETIEDYESQSANYEKTTSENKLVTQAKNQDVKYKNAEMTSLSKTLSETSGDLDGVNAELDAVLEQLAKINGQCIGKADSYEEKKKRREAELNGLKEAVQTLNGEAVLFQKEKQSQLRR